MTTNIGGDIDDVTEAIQAGRVYVVTGKPRPMSRDLGGFIGEHGVAYGDLIRFVHVVSKPAGGEIRGYVLTADGRLRLRLPCRSGRWDAMDRAVLAQVDGARSIAPYEVGDDGVVRP